MKMKPLLYFVSLFILLSSVGEAQIPKDSTAKKRPDTTKVVQRKVPQSGKKNLPVDTTKVLKKIPVRVQDTVLPKPKTAPVTNNQQPPAAAIVQNSPKIEDTLSNKRIIDSAAVGDTVAVKNYRDIANELLLKNRFINVKDAPVFFIQKERTVVGKEFLFYSIFVIILILGIFKTFYRGYFNNLFRVFFNTSLRQSQLADQLLQAKLPSFILNIFFTISMGVYLWLLLKNFHPVSIVSNQMLLPLCIAVIAVLYFLKFCLLKFMGWLSDIRETTDNYIFVIFLVNKIMGIILVPFIILLAFSMPSWTNSVARISVLVLALFFLSRYVKSYGVNQKKVSVHPFHFLIYIVGAEILPLFIFYKLAVDYLI
jgi:hypothetical protein